MTSVVGRALEADERRSEGAERAALVGGAVPHVANLPTAILQLQWLAANRATVAARTPPLPTSSGP